jgi:hypothetical protein
MKIVINPRVNLCNDSEGVSLSQVASSLKDIDEWIEKHE